MPKHIALFGAMLFILVLAGCGSLTLEPPPPTATGPTGAGPARPTVDPAPATRPPTAAPAVTARPDDPATPPSLQLQTNDPVEGDERASSIGARSAPDASALAPMSAVEVVDEVWPAVVTVINGVSTGPFGEGGVQQAGRGTGFVIDEQGHIVTNQHVVAGGDRLEVIFSNGEKRPAELVGTDRLSDLAVVRVDGELPAVVAFGDSEALQVGQPILAIGSPLGEFTGTVTDGIISALNRDFPRQAGSLGLAEYNNLIQHNAAINPGNSGGPLFDLAGNVVGVNTLGIPVSPDGAPVQGLFFAIPSNSVARIASQLIEFGRAIYPYFGATPGEISPELAAEFDLPVDYGAFLIEVEPGTPAERAGIESGDIVTALGGEAIDAERSFSEVLFQFEPGETVPVTLIRGNEELQVEITLGERDT
ncbi:MAG: trypsin-like peptidase domain-containing protein [Chloroflexota bacterium]|nr:trypsin-like peptidase domain-containing protein [Chloroflexota bacterium]